MPVTLCNKKCREAREASGTVTTKAPGQDSLEPHEVSTLYQTGARSAAGGSAQSTPEQTDSPNPGGFIQRLGRRRPLLRIADVDPSTPAEDVPGSSSKIETLAARAAAGIALFQPDDAELGERQAYVTRKNTVGQRLGVITHIIEHGPGGEVLSRRAA